MWHNFMENIKFFQESQKSSKTKIRKSRASKKVRSMIHDPSPPNQTPAMVQAAKLKEWDLASWSKQKCVLIAKDKNMEPDTAFSGAGCTKKYQQHHVEQCEMEYGGYHPDNQPYADLIETPWVRAGKYLLVPLIAPTPAPAIVPDPVPEANAEVEVEHAEPVEPAPEVPEYVNGVNSDGHVQPGFPVGNPWVGQQDYRGVHGPPCVMHMPRKPKKFGIEYISAADAWCGMCVNIQK